MSPIRSGGSAPGRRRSLCQWCSGGGRDPEGTSPPRLAAPSAGTACTAARCAAAVAVGGVGGVDGGAVDGGGGRESPAGRRQAPASGSCNSPESGWVDSRSVSIPRTVGTSGPHSWS